MRRLPVYVLLDCSESMIGDGVTALREGVCSMLTTLKRNPHALETAWISFIGFSSSARVLCELTPLEDVAEPELRLGNGTALGSALELLAERLMQEVRMGSVSAKGDFRPLVLLLTDGQPTDDWKIAKTKFDLVTSRMVANFYVIGCGDDVDYRILGQLSDIVFSSPEMNPDAMAKLFVWLTATVSSASVGVSDGRDGTIETIGKLPDSLRKIDLSKDRLPIRRKQVFISAVCSKTKRRYLMRYAQNSGSGRYAAVRSHPLDQETLVTPGSSSGGSLDSNNFDGIPPCPYCESQMAIAHGAPCGVISCGGAFDIRKMMHNCPGCDSRFEVEIGGGFDIKTELG